MEYRQANVADAALLARLNKELVVDEGHRNAMSMAELGQRMTGWLAGNYAATLFERDGQTLGYALYRREADHIYLRQFYVCAAFRRSGVGREALAWLRQHAWTDVRRIRLDVLVGNARAIAFWRSVGFDDYCLTMELGVERVRPDPSPPSA